MLKQRSAALSLICGVLIPAVLTGCVGRNSSGTPGVAHSQPPESLTFFVASDLHYNWPVKGEFTSQRNLIKQMNATPGQPYPTNLSGTVDKPRAVLLLGDLTQAVGGGALETWQKDWGMTGEGLLQFPVYEGVGNHDAHHPKSWAVLQARNRKRTGITALSTNGYHYSWTWSGIHFVMLNLCAANLDGTKPNALASHGALEFLAQDLAQQVGRSGRPIILLQHYGLQPVHQWSPPRLDEFYRAVKDYNILCIMHGHTHHARTYRWHDIDVLDDGSLKKDPKGKAPDFFVVNIQGDRLTVLERTIHGEWGKVRLQKDFSRGASPWRNN